MAAAIIVCGARVRMDVARHAPGGIDFDQHIGQAGLVEDSAPQCLLDVIFRAELRHQDDWRGATRRRQLNRGAKDLAGHRDAALDGLIAAVRRDQLRERIAAAHA